MTAHKDKGYGVVVLTNSNHPDFIEEVIRAVAHTYAWGNYVPVYKKMAMDTSKFSSLRGRYHNSNDGLIKVFSEGSRLFRKFLPRHPTELFQISDSTFIGREVTRSFNSKPIRQMVNSISCSSTAMANGSLSILK